MAKTKVDIVSGFLGAGKTTFIKLLLEKAIKDEQVVLIENEFGEIGIDGGFLKDTGIEIREMSQGCICCSLVGDFAASLKEILTTYKPDRIIIEPSGVGKLSDVMKAIAGVEEELGVENNSAVTIVDAKKTKLYERNFGEFFDNQIQFATTVVMSRTDIASPETVAGALAIIRGLNPTATVVTTPLKDLPAEQLLQILESPVDLKTELLAQVKDGEDPEEHEHHHHHHHGEEGHECCHHHDHDEDEEEHECCHHHGHDEDEEEHECCHHHDHDGEEHEHECHHDHEHHHGHECGCGHHHDADEVFESWGIENAPAMTEAQLKEFLEKLSDDEFGVVLRAKGMIKNAEGDDWLHFDMVPEETEIRHGAPDLTGKLCVIGAQLKHELLDKEFGR
jgi:G3E family GTPase